MGMDTITGKLTIFLAVPLLICLSVVGFMGINVPFFAMIFGSLLILGGVLGLFDAFAEFGFDFKKVLFIFISLLIITIGVNVFYQIPFVGIYLSSLYLEGLVNLVVSGVIGLYLIIDAFTRM